MHHFTRVEDGDARCKLLARSIVNRGAEPQEGGGIDQVWIADPKVYPSIPMPH